MEDDYSNDPYFNELQSLGSSGTTPTLEEEEDLDLITQTRASMESGEIPEAVPSTDTPAPTPATDSVQADTALAQMENEKAYTPAKIYKGVDTKLSEPSVVDSIGTVVGEAFDAVVGIGTTNLIDNAGQLYNQITGTESTDVVEKSSDQLVEEQQKLFLELQKTLDSTGLDVNDLQTLSSIDNEVVFDLENKESKVKPGIIESFKFGVISGYKGLESTIAGGSGLIAKLVGANQTSDTLLEGASLINEDAGQYRSDYNSLKGLIDNYDGNLGETLGQSGSFAASVLGENVIDLVGSLGSFGMAAVGKRAITHGIEKAVAKGIAKEMTEKGLSQELAEDVVRSNVEKFLASEVGMSQVKKEAAERFANKYGKDYLLNTATKLQFGQNVVQETGAIATDQFVENGEVSPMAAIGFGLAAAAVDTIADRALGQTFLNKDSAKLFSKEFIKDLPVKTAGQVALGAGTEGVQSVLSNLGVNPNTAFTPENLWEVAESMAAGGIAQGVGAAGGNVSAATTQQFRESAETVAQVAATGDRLSQTSTTNKTGEALKKMAAEKAQADAAKVASEAAKSAKANVVPPASTVPPTTSPVDDPLSVDDDDDTVIDVTDEADTDNEVVDTEVANVTTKPTPTVEDTSKLPQDLKGAKPRYSYGSKGFELEFESDLDKAAFIAAQKNPSKRDKDYVEWATKASGLSESGVRAHGAIVSEAIKSRAKNMDAGKITLPKIPVAAPIVEATNLPTEDLVNDNLPPEEDAPIVVDETISGTIPEGATEVAVTTNQEGQNENTNTTTSNEIDGSNDNQNSDPVLLEPLSESTERTELEVTPRSSFEEIIPSEKTISKIAVDSLAPEEKTAITSIAAGVGVSEAVQSLPPPSRRKVKKKIKEAQLEEAAPGYLPSAKRSKAGLVLDTPEFTERFGTPKEKAAYQLYKNPNRENRAALIEEARDLYPILKDAPEKEVLEAATNYGKMMDRELSSMESTKELLPENPPDLEQGEKNSKWQAKANTIIRRANRASETDLNEGLAYLRKAIEEEEDPRTLDILARTDNEAAKSAVAKNQNTSQDTIRFLAEGPVNNPTYFALLKHKNTPKDIQEDMQNNPGKASYRSNEPAKAQGADDLFNALSVKSGEEKVVKASDVLGVLTERTKNPTIKTVLGKIASSPLKDMPITFKDMDGDVAGYYDTDANKIVINSSATHVGGAKRTVVHELMHAATYKGLNAPIDSLNPIQRAARESLEDLHSELGLDDSQDLNEFVSELFSDESAQDALNSLQDGKKTVWQKVKGLISKLVTGTSVAQQNNAVSALIDLIDNPVGLKVEGGGKLYRLIKGDEFQERYYKGSTDEGAKGALKRAVKGVTVGKLNENVKKILALSSGLGKAELYQLASYTKEFVKELKIAQKDGVTGELAVKSLGTNENLISSDTYADIKNKARTAEDVAIANAGFGWLTATQRAEFKKLTTKTDQLQYLSTKLSATAKIEVAKKADRAYVVTYSTLEKNALEAGQDRAWDGIQEAFNEIGKLTGNDRLQKVISKMRKQIDKLTQVLIDRGIGADKASTFLGNQMKYLTRAYRIFESPDAVRELLRDTEKQANLRKFVQADMVSREADKLRAEMRSRGQFITRKDAIATAETMVTPEMVDEAAEMIMSPDALSKLDPTLPAGKRANQILKERKDIPEAIQEAWGLHKGDAKMAAFQTVSKMSTLLNNKDTGERLLKEGMANNWISKTKVPGLKQIPTNSPYPDLQGMYAPEEFVKALEEFNTPTDTAFLMRGLATLSRIAAVSKTAGNFPAGPIRNAVGVPIILMSNGTIGSPTQYLQRFKDAVATLRGKTPEARMEYAKDLQKYGLVGDNMAQAFVRDMAAVSNSSKSFQALDKLTRGLLTKYTNLEGKAMATYNLPDDVGKIIQWESEKEYLKKAHPTWTEDQIKERAAELTRDTSPTNSLAYKGADWLRKEVPVVAQFVSFTTEGYRVTANIWNTGLDEIKSDNPVVKQRGYKRIIGLAVARGVTTSLSVGSAAVAGVMGGALAETLREFVPPWMKDSNIFYMKDEDGGYSVIDLSTLDPYDQVNRPFYAAANALKYSDKPIMDAVSAFVGTLIEPFVSEQIGIGAINDAFNKNEKPSGGRIYFESDGPWEKAVKASTYVLKQVLLPGAVNNLEKINKAYQEGTGMGSAIASTFGVSSYKIVPEKGLGYEAAEFNNMASDISQSLKADIKGATPEKAQARYNEHNDRRRALVRKLYVKVEGLKELGYDTSEIVGILQSKRVSGQTINEVMDGMYNPLTLSRQTLNQMSPEDQQAYFDARSNAETQMLHE